MSCEQSAPIGRAIVTHSRSWYTLAAIRNLGRHGVEVIAGDQYSLTPGALSRYAVASFRYPDPERDTAGFLDAMECVVKDSAPPSDIPYVLLPMHRESYVIARHRQRFEPYIHVPLPRSELMDHMNNTRRLIRLAQDRGIPVPRTWMPDDDAALERALAEVRLPAYVKLPESVGGVSVTKVATTDELRAVFTGWVETYALQGDRRPLIQELAPGDDYRLSALFCRGNVRASLAYRNAANIPRGSGPGAVRETVWAPHLETLLCDLLGTMRWHGLVEADFRWDGRSEDSAMLLEINPRSFSGLFHAIASGIDYPWLLFRMAVDGDLSPVERTDMYVRTETPVLGLLATIGEIADSEAMLARLEESWIAAREALASGGLWRAMRRLFDGLRESLDASVRINRVQKLLRDHGDSVTEILDGDDPLPVLGVLYLMAHFVRHGTITPELMVGVPPSVS